MWITNAACRCLHRVRQDRGEKFTPSSSSALSRIQARNEEQRGHPRQLDNPDFPGKLQVPKENLCTRSARHIVEFNILNAGASRLAPPAWRSKHVLMTSSKYAKERQSVGKQMATRPEKEKLAEMAIPDFRGGIHGVPLPRGTSRRRWPPLRLRRQDSETP